MIDINEIETKFIPTKFIDKENVEHTYYLKEGETLIKDKEGEPVLRYYNSKYGFWVNVSFNKKGEESCTEYLKETLKKIAIQKYNIN